MRVAGCVLLSALWLPCAALADDSTLQAPDAYLGPDVAKWGTPRVIVAPEYPPGALEHRVTGSVTVGGFISPEGNLTEPQYTVDPPTATVLIDAVKGVIGLWAFYAPVGDTCLPTTSPVLVQVWFEIRDGKPQIGVSREATKAVHRDSDPTFKVLDTYEPRYTRKMVLHRWQGHVYARMEIDPAGNVIRVVAQEFPHVERVDYRGDLEAVTEQALVRWKYSPAAPGASRTRIACIDVVFRMRD